MASTSEPNLARMAGMIGEPARAAMLAALLGGEWLSAGELARRAGVAPPTASEHLARLVEHGLITRRRSGRHRYYALTDGDVAAALESLARISPPPPASTRSGSVEQRALRFARTCYDHLAGTLSVLLTDTLRDRGLIAANGYEITAPGEEWLSGLDIDVDALRRKRRTFARPCLDWSERRHHLAGAVGAAITATMLERRWLVRLEETRALRLTLRGRDALHRALALEIEPPRFEWGAPRDRTRRAIAASDTTARRLATK